MTAFIVLQWGEPFEVVLVHNLDTQDEDAEERVRAKLQAHYARGRRDQFRVEPIQHSHTGIRDLLDEDNQPV